MKGHQRYEWTYLRMRGYKSIGGMKNGIALSQWLYSGERNGGVRRAKRFTENKVLKLAHRLWDSGPETLP